VDELTITVIALGASVLFGEIAYRFKVPRVIGQMLAGIFLGLPLIAGSLFLGVTKEYIEFMANLGIIFLLLLVGMELDFKSLRKVSKDAGLVAFAASIVPLLLGFAIGKLFGYSDIVSLVLGAALSITSEGTKAIVLLELKVLKTRLGEIMLASAVADDLFEMLLLSIIIIIGQGQNVTEFGLVLLEIGGFFIIVFAAFKLIPIFIKYIHRKKSHVGMFSMVILLSLIIATISQSFGLGPIIGAFIGGLIIQMSLSEYREEEKELMENFKVMTLGFIAPFFFLNIGLQFSAQTISANLLLTVTVVIVAILGKMLGSVIIKPFSDMSWKQVALVGVAMNSRGAVELVIAGIALSQNLIPQEIFSSIVLMTIVTTLSFPLVLSYVIRRNPGIMG